MVRPPAAPHERQRGAIAAASLASACLLVVGFVALAPAVVQSAAPQLVESPQVNIVDFAFQPADLTVAQHTTVVWTNGSTHDHSVVQQDTFDSGTIGPGTEFSHVFDEVGRWTYRCAFHPDLMKGSVTVTAAGATPSPPAESPSAPVSPPAATVGPSATPVGATPSVTPAGSAPPPTAISTSPSASQLPTVTPSPIQTEGPDASRGGASPAVLAVAAVAILAAIAVLGVLVARRRSG